MPEADRDYFIESDAKASGVGDIVFATGKVERARIKADGTGTGWANVIGGLMTAIFNVKTQYGAVGDGVTNDQAAIQAAIAAAKLAGGGIVFFPTGIYKCSSPLTADSSAGVRLVGPSGPLDRTNTPVSEIRFTATGSTPQLTAKTSTGFSIEHLAVRYSSTSFTGRLIDVTGTTPSPTYKPTFKTALISGTTGVDTADALIDLGNTVEATFEDCTLSRAAYGVVGWDGTATYSTAVTMKGGRFVDLRTAAIKNPHQSWALYSVVFEPTALGVPCGIVGSAAFPALGVSLFGCGIWDATTGGVWLDLYGNGITLVGNYVEVTTGITYCRLNGTVRGFESRGNLIRGGAAAVYLATANTPVITDFEASDFFINGVSDNQNGLTGITRRVNRSAVALRVTTITASYVAGAADFGSIILADATAGVINVTLPDSQLAGAAGTTIVVKKTDASVNAVNANPIGGQRVDAGFGSALAAQHASFILVCDGALAPGGWRIAGKV